jgi:hypothetical protein
MSNTELAMKVQKHVLEVMCAPDIDIHRLTKTQIIIMIADHMASNELKSSTAKALFKVLLAE